ncbi:MAG TPA: MCE family protein [Acidimicrobiales bacterium]|jgi:virulence factor Mce-like protein|nr:MCE family protein [Acidimicrobiales bacterium]
MRGRRVLASVTVAVVASLGLGSCSLVGGDSGGTTLTAWFPRAVALYKSSDVRVLGLVSGKITDVDVIGDRVKVTMKVDKDTPIPADVNAMIVPQSLIGERYVQLFPAWKEGEAKIADGATIPESRTSVPVEPDEALAALKKFIDTLDPKATGKLVSNLAADLKGTGGDLNRAVSGLADLASTVASKDAEIARIIDNFDDFTATLRTREAQLGTVMDQFARMTSIIADERRSIEGLVKGLGQVSGDALDLVSEHGAKLDTDLQQLTRALATVDANLESVSQLLDAGPVLATGLIDGHDPQYHRIDLRQNFSPTAAQAFSTVLDALGIPGGDSICLPVDVDCVPNPFGAQQPASSVPTVPPIAPPAGAAAAPTTVLPPVTVPLPTTTVPGSTTTTAPKSPIDTLLDLLGQAGTGGRAAIVTPSPSTAERASSGITSIGRLFGRAARTLLGVAR